MLVTCCIVVFGSHSLKVTTRVMELHVVFVQNKDAMLNRYVQSVTNCKMIGPQAKAAKIEKARKVFQGKNCQLDKAVKKYVEALKYLPKPEKKQQK